MKISYMLSFILENLAYEKEIADKLHTHGRGTSGVAGYGDHGADTNLIADDGSKHGLEIKRNTHSRLSQIAIAHHPDLGWHIKSNSRLRSPEYAKHIENSGILEKLNSEWGSPEEKHPTKDIYHNDEHGAAGVDAFYGKDKNVPYIHIGGHGFYKTGDSDPAKLNAPKISGNSFRLRARQKQIRPGYKVFTISGITSAKGLNKSHLSLDAEPT